MQATAVPARITGLRGWRTTPSLLKLAGALIVALAAGFSLATAAAADRHERALRTIGTDATRSIVAAQRIKAGLAQMDVLASQALLAEPGSRADEVTQRYADVRRSSQQDIGVALRNITYGAAEEVPSQQIEYLLPIYHSLVEQAWAAHAARDDATALARYRTASQLMRERLLPAADALDRANTFALNQGHQDEIASAESMSAVAGDAGVVLLILLVVA